MPGLDKVFDRDANTTSGCVTRNTITRSRMVDRPRVKAKPCTCATATM